EAEIGLARSLRHPEVETLSLRDDPLILVAQPAAWPGPARRARLEEVADRPLIFFDRGSGDWALTHGLFRRAGFVPNVALAAEARALLGVLRSALSDTGRVPRAVRLRRRALRGSSLMRPRRRR